MKYILAASAFACTLPALALAQTMGGSSNVMSNTMQSGSAGSAQSTSLNAQDKIFIKKAAYSGLAEVADGQLAQSKGDSSSQKIAARMITDHSKANDQLTSISQSVGDPAPTQTDAKHQKIHQQLSGLSGSAFDSKYLKTELQGHEMTIAAFKTEASSGQNPQLKAFASQTLPILQMHLQMIKSAA